MLLQLFSFSALYVLLVIAGQIFFKRAAGGLDTSSFKQFSATLLLNANLYIATAFYVAAMVLWVWLLKHAPLSRLFPVMSAILLIAIPLASQHFLEEVLSFKYWAGVVLIMCGIGFIAWEMMLVEGA